MLEKLSLVVVMWVGPMVLHPCDAVCDCVACTENSSPQHRSRSSRYANHMHQPSWYTHPRTLLHHVQVGATRDQKRGSTVFMCRKEFSIVCMWCKIGAKSRSDKMRGRVALAVKSARASFRSSNTQSQTHQVSTFDQLCQPSFDSLSFRHQFFFKHNGSFFF